VPGGTIHVAFAPGDIALPKEKLLDWIRMSARAVTTYYGRFPVSSLRLLLVPVDGGRIRGGTTWGYRGAAIRIPLGRDSTEDVLRRDWVMVHEMVHTALPDMPDRYAWLSEGLAVYVEPIARCRPATSRREIWQAMMRDMPKATASQPGPRQHRHLGRKYWGGAMFCLLADIEIRSARIIASACRTRCAACSPRRQSSRTGRSTAFYRPPTRPSAWRCSFAFDEMGPKPVTPDLAALWRDLGEADWRRSWSTTPRRSRRSARRSPRRSRSRASRSARSATLTSSRRGNRSLSLPNRSSSIPKG
jgi:hypothetical protein